VTEPTRIARVAVPVPLARLFDYQIPGSEPTPAVGSRVQVPFSGRRLIGLCTAVNPPDAHDKLKSVYRVLDQDDLSDIEFEAELTGFDELIRLLTGRRGRTEEKRRARC